MLLESKIVIRRTPEQVWSFLGNVSNIPKWDRGVAFTQEASPGTKGIGQEFDTFAHGDRQDGADAKGKMSYRVVRAEADRCTIRLASSSGNARYFKSAEWNFRVEPSAEGARLTCSANFKLRFRYLILAPVFYFMRSAIRTDLESLKRVLESQS